MFYSHEGELYRRNTSFRDSKANARSPDVAQIWRCNRMVS
jgi:hypothetical protein